MTMRSQYIPALDETLTGVGFNDLNPNQIPGNLSVIFGSPEGSLEASFEEKSIQPRRKHDWTSFEHYKRSTEYSYDSFPVVSTSFVSSDSGLAGHVFTHTDPAYAWDPTHYGYVGNPILGLPELYRVTGTGIIPAPPGWGNLIGTALKEMLPQIRPGLSSLNSLYELKDFKSLPKTFKSIRSILANLPLLFSKFKKAKTLKQLAAAIADANLQAQFNILPLRSDLKATWDAAAAVKKQLNKLLDREAQKNRRHYATDISSNFPYVSHQTEPFGFSGFLYGGGVRYPNIWGSFRQRRIAQTRAQFHATIEYSYYYSQFQRENALLLAQLDYFGVNFNPAILWNALKWTFVVDWFISVSRYFDQFKVSNLKPLTVIHNFAASVNYDRTTTLFKEKVASGHSYGGQVKVCTCIESSYRRDSGIVDLYVPLTGSGLNLKEFVLSTSLAFSRMRH